MGNEISYLYSPFTKQSVAKGDNPPLLLVFILTEIVNLETQEDTAFENPSLLPFDWSLAVSGWTKIQEHCKLLAYAFPHHNLEEILQSVHMKKTQSLLKHLAPLIQNTSTSKALSHFFSGHKDYSPLFQTETT